MSVTELVDRKGTALEEAARAYLESHGAADCMSAKSVSRAPEDATPRYEWHKPWFQRLFGMGCLSCGSAGWVQRVIATPNTGHWFPRTVKLANWVATLAPRGWSLLRTVLSRTVDDATYAERMETCYNHNRGSQACAVRYLRQTGRGIVEELHCGKCNCPRTRAAALVRTDEPKTWFGRILRRLFPGKNRKSGWRCPAGLHAGSDRDAAYKEYVQVQRNTPMGNGGTDASGN